MGTATATIGSFVQSRDQFASTEHRWDPSTYLNPGMSNPIRAAKLVVTVWRMPPWPSSR